jgi:hypothetical protein
MLEQGNRPVAKTNGSEPPAKTALEKLKQVGDLLCAHRFGAISFLELLDKLENVLNIQSKRPRTTIDTE